MKSFLTRSPSPVIVSPPWQGSARSIEPVQMLLSKDGSDIRQFQVSLEKVDAGLFSIVKCKCLDAGS